MEHQDSADFAEHPATPVTETQLSADEASGRIRVRLPSTKPLVVYGILAITIVIFLLQMITKYTSGMDVPLILGAKFGPDILRGQYWRLITPILLHGSILHLLFNMYALWILGRELEPAWGYLDFLLFYLVTGFGGNVFSYFFTPNTISVGASTSLFGMIVAQGFLIFKNRKFFKNYRKAISSTIYIVVINLIIGMQSGIDNWGHLGGLVAGVILCLISCPTFDIRWSEQHDSLELKDTISRPRRIAGFVITFLLFALLAWQRITKA